MTISSNELAQLLSEVLTTVTGTPVENNSDCASAAEPRVQAEIAIDGAWSGTLTFDCGLGLARHIASGFFACPAAEVSGDDAMAAAKEFVNIIAGHVKTLLPGPSSLAMPTGGEETCSSLPPQKPEIDLEAVFMGSRVGVTLAKTSPVTDGSQSSARNK